jgi:methylglyoxal synthase
MHLLKNRIKIAVIAHDGKKADMVSFIMKRLDFFTSENVEVIATGTTGKHLIHAGLSKVHTVLSGPMGGDAQIASMITEGKIDAVIFFIDPLEVHPHQVDVSMLLRICNVHDIPLATNYKTGKMVIDCLESFPK